MQVIHPICCGIDVHQAQLTACLRRVDMDGQVTKEVASRRPRPGPSWRRWARRCRTLGRRPAWHLGGDIL